MDLIPLIPPSEEQKKLEAYFHQLLWEFHSWYPNKLRT
jgi:hypothetical protein